MANKWTFIQITISCTTILPWLLCSAQHHNQQQLPMQQHGGSIGSGGGAGLASSGFSNWRPDFGESMPAVKNGSTGSGVTYYWGSHQVGESVLAFSKDRLSSPSPVNAYRTVSYQNGQSRISYLEVFVRNAAGLDQVYVSHGGIGASFIGVFVGSQTPTTFFEYKAILYGFE